MNRVEKFRQKRISRNRTIAAVLLFFFLLVTGILAVDDCTNFLVSGRGGFALAAVSSRETCLEITFMNRKFYLNTQYINRDLKNLKNKLNELFK